jgi:hypothetical protein
MKNPTKRINREIITKDVGVFASFLFHSDPDLHWLLQYITFHIN